MTLRPDHVAALAEIAETWPGRAAVIIGATALGFYVDMRWRQTDDVDLVVAVDIDELEQIVQRPGWRQHPRKEHEFRSPRGARVDILPAAAALIERGSISWPSGHVMSLAGMDLAFAHCSLHNAGASLHVAVAPPPVVTVLKMAAFLDRPPERERDLGDIAYLLDLYIDDESDRRWDEAAALDFDLAPAFLLGRDIGRLAGASHRVLVAQFLERVADPDSVFHARMARLGPIAWPGEADALARRLAAFGQGFEGVPADSLT
jgi:predicted nucleotidyltransferase